MNNSAFSLDRYGAMLPRELLGTGKLSETKIKEIWRDWEGQAPDKALAFSITTLAEAADSYYCSKESHQTMHDQFPCPGNNLTTC